MQLTNTSTANGSIQVWLRKNGANIADSSSHYDVPDKQGSSFSSEILTVNYVLNVVANDVFQLYWQTANASVSIETLAASGTYPRTPSVILTATQVMYTQSGYSGTSGYSGFSGISGQNGASGISGYSGAVGASGFSGFSGQDGLSGTSGFSGYSGINGLSGYSGQDGLSGTSGISGFSGWSGISGYSGLGISGYSGFSGISGYSGYSGSGISGYSGSGISGYSGYSGFSGYSGVNAYVAPRVTSTTSASSITPDAGTTDQYELTAQAVGLTINAPTGSPVDGQKLIIRILDNGGAQTLTWTTSSGGYRIVGTTLPTTTTASKILYVGCIYNTTATFWDVIALAQQA